MALVKGKPAGTATVLPGQHAFRGSFVLAEAGAYGYAFQLKDSDGVESADSPRYEIEAAADQSPEVAIDTPAADVTVTADANLPVTVSAKDDWGLRELRLRFHVGDTPEERASTLPLATESPQSEHRRVAIMWPLASLSLSEGMRIVFHAEATDWFDLGLPHVGKSPSRVLSIVSAKQKEIEIVSRQAELLRLLERAQEAQSHTKDQVADLDVQLDKAGKLRPADIDVLKRVEADQRQVNSILANPSEGAAAAVRNLLEELKQNHIASPQTRERLKRFDRELTELGRSHLATLDNHLTRAVKMAELPDPASSGASRAEQSKSLKAARREQGIVLDSLKTMLGDLAQWRDWQGIHEGLRELVDGQEKLNGETTDLSRTTVAKAFSELGKQDQADLARLAERQSQLAEQVKGLEQRLRDAANGLKSSNPEAAQDADRTLKSLEHSDPQARMQKIGAQLAKNDIGLAMGRQKQLLDELRKLDRTFSQRPETDLQSLVARMGEAQQSVDSLRKKEESLRKRTEELVKRKDSKAAAALEMLRKEQNALEQAADETARELRRLGAEDSTENLRQAQNRMAEAGEHLDGGRAAAAGAQQEKAIDELKRAARALAQSKQKADQQLAQQGLFRVADQLAGLVARQKTVVDETKRLGSERAQNAQLDPRPDP